MSCKDPELSSPAAKRSKLPEDDEKEEEEDPWTEETLKVTNLPEKFMERLFVSCLEKARKRHGIYDSVSDCIVKCEPFLKEGYVRVKYINSEIPPKMAEVTDCIFQKKKLVFEAPIHLCTTITDDNNEDMMDTSAHAEAEMECDSTLTAGPFHSSTPTENSSAEVVTLMGRLTPFKKRLDLYFNEEKVKVAEDSEKSDLLPQDDDIATEVDTHSQVDGYDTNVDPTHVPSIYRREPTSQVRIKDLPENFEVVNVIYEIHKALWKQTELEVSHKPIIHSDSDGEKCVILTFDCPENAALAVGLKDLVEYEDTFLTMEQLFQEPALLQTPSNKVRVSDLPSDFNVVNIIYEIHKALWKQTKIKRSHKPIIHSDSDGEKCVILTFDLPENAALAVGLKDPVEYEDTLLTMEQLFQEPALLQTPSNKVRVSDLPSDFNVVNIIYEIHKALWKQTKIKRSHKPIIHSDSDGEKCVILTFDLPENAALAVGLKDPVEYEDTFLTLEQMFEEAPQPQVNNATDEVSDVAQSVLNNESSHCENSLEVSNPQEVSLVKVDFDPQGYPMIPKGVVTRTDWPTFETVKFLEAVLKFRLDLLHRSTIKQKQGWVSVTEFMYQRELYYTCKKLKLKLKNLITVYEENKDQSWEFYRSIEMYLNIDEPVDFNVVTDMLDKYKPTPAPIRSSLVERNKIVCGVVTLANCGPEELSHLFDEKSTFMLIASYNTYKPLFDDDIHRSDQLYGEISEKLSKFGRKFSGEDCSKRMGYLAKRYKEIEDMRLLCSGSGSDMLNWIYYDAMSQVFEKSRVMNPQKLMAFGSSKMVQVRKDDDDDEDEEGEDSNNNVASHKGRKSKKKKSQKKNSYSSSVSLQSFKERKLALQGQFNSCFADLTQALASSRK